MLTDKQKKWIDSQPTAQELMRKLVKAGIPFMQYKEIVDYYSKKEKRQELENR